MGVPIPDKPVFPGVFSFDEETERDPEKLFDALMKIMDKAMNTAEAYGMTAILAVHDWSPLSDKERAEAMYVGNPLAAKALAVRVAETLG